MDNPQKPTLLSFCTGYGGLDLGVARALGGVRTVANVEIDSFACSNLVAKMEAELLDASPIWTDLKTFPSEEFHGCVDIITAGFPCQPFSVAGLRAGTEDDRHLWPIIERSIDAIRPGAVFFENVPGIISAQTIEHRSDLMGHLAALDEEAKQLGAFDAWYLRRHAQRLHRRFLQHAGMSVLLYVISRLESMGYKATAGLFTSSECGAPHKRQRVFILGLSNSGRARFEGSELASVLRERRRKEGRTACELHSSLSDTNRSRFTLHGNNAGMGREQQWPAGPGPYQHDWEPRRTIDRSLAYSHRMRKSQQEGLESSERRRAIDSSEEWGNSQSDDERRTSDQQDGQRLEYRGPGEQLADSSNRQLQERRRRSEERNGAGSTSETMADPENDNRRCGECGEEEGTRAGELRRRGSSGGSEGAIESELGLHFNEHSSEMGEAINEKQTPTPYQVLLTLWDRNEAQEIQWSSRRPENVLAEEVLLSRLQLDRFPQRVCYYVWCVQARHPVKRFDLPKLWLNEKCWSSSQRQGYSQQFRRELAYALCVMSYQDALGRGETSLEGTPTLQDMRRSSERAWVLQQTLPEIQEVWRSEFDEETWTTRAYWEAAELGRSRIDELRLCGNGVVPRSAEKAFRTLYRELTK